MVHEVPGWIEGRALLGAGILVHVAVFLIAYALTGMLVARGWTDERPAGERVAVTATTMDERGY